MSLYFLLVTGLIRDLRKDTVSGEKPDSFLETNYVFSVFVSTLVSAAGVPISGISDIGSGGGVVAIVYPIQARIARITATPKKAVTSIVICHQKIRRSAYTTIPITLPPKIAPPTALSFAMKPTFVPELPI